jgi:hypothetical protein
MKNKSYWQAAYIGSDDAKAIVKSWFAPMCEGMVPYKADILCDVETDKEKKLRAFMTDDKNNHFKFERTRGANTFSISRKPTTAALGEAEAK